MRTLLRFATCLVIAGCASAAFADDLPEGFLIFKVGGGADCPYHTIQDAVNAAAQHPGVDLVWIAMDQSYTDQHVVVTDQDIEIEGGFTDCDDIDPGSDLTTITGTSGHSVFEIEGTSHVYLGNLEITGAVMDTSHSGGGIYFGGQGDLTLKTTWVHNNQAGYGGGIDMSPSAASTLNLLAGTTISGNTALVSGGGVRIEGLTTLDVISVAGEQPVFIAVNGALGQGEIGYGGGLEVLGPAVANIGSASIDVNAAPYGAGIAALGTEQGPPEVNLFTSDAGVPVSVHDNAASETGGGIFLKPHGPFFAQLCAQDFVLSGNSAANGAALYADVQGDGLGDAFAFFNGICASPPGAVACAAGTECNQINDNNATAGAVILLQSGAALYANHFAARINQGAQLIYLVADTQSSSGDYVQLHNCLLADNAVTGNLILGTGGAFDSASGSQLVIDTCTLTGNTYGMETFPVIDTNVNFLSVTNSIVYDAPQSPLFFGGSAGDLTTQYVLTNDASHFEGGLGVVEGAPTFVDVAGFNYRLARSSLGVDFAPGLDGVDLDGNPRTVDLTDVANGFGTMDVGAYEIQTQPQVPDLIFHSGFEL